MQLFENESLLDLTQFQLAHEAPLVVVLSA
jgi:hypothetical protein